jgi:signal transduction histidine kinase
LATAVRTECEGHDRAQTAQLAEAVAVLARKNEALEDFAALVAHELKAPLLDALAADDPRAPVARAIDLVDALLRSARNTRLGETASAREILAEVLREVAPAGARITSDLSPELMLPAGALRVILSNLVRNAVAAGARSIHVSTECAAGGWSLVVDDDGVGLAASGYATGNGLGLSLSRGLANRFGAVLELAPRPVCGTRATLQLAEAA